MAFQIERPVVEVVTEADYEAPRIERLGSLAELTQGGGIGPEDGFAGAGDEGSL